MSRGDVLILFVSLSLLMCLVLGVTHEIICRINVPASEPMDWMWGGLKASVWNHSILEAAKLPERLILIHSSYITGNESVSNKGDG